MQELFVVLTCDKCEHVWNLWWVESDVFGHDIDMYYMEERCPRCDAHFRHIHRVDNPYFQHELEHQILGKPPQPVRVGDEDCGCFA